MDWLSAFDLRLDRVFFDDQDSMAEILKNPAPIVLSPGPNHPKDIPQTISLLRSRKENVPIFGICLGLQALAYSEGFEVGPSQNSFHGTKQKINLKNESKLLKNLPSTFCAATYNSLVVKNVSKDWSVLAINEHNEIQMIENLQRKSLGIQFHPESFLSDRIFDTNSIKKFFALYRAHDSEVVIK